MRPTRLLWLCIVFVCVSACASGPAPERSPRHLRQSLRYLNKGAALYTKGCFPNALARFHEAHERYVAADHIEGVAASLNSIANVYFQLNELDSALVIYNEAIALYRQLDDRSGLVRALSNKGAALIADGDLDAGGAVLDDADDLAGNAGPLLPLRLKNRALWMMKRGNYSDAKALLSRAIDFSTRAPTDQTATLHYTMGRLLLATDKPSQAVAQFSIALKTDRANGAYHAIAEDLGALGACHEHMAEYGQATAYYQRSLKIFALLENHRQSGAMRRSLERVAPRAGVDIRATMHWVELWRKGAKEANLCR